MSRNRAARNLHRRHEFAGRVPTRGRVRARLPRERRPSYNVAYAWKPKLGEKGAPDEVQVYKVGEQAKVLELITSEAESPSKAKVTITVVGEGRWDKAEIAAARASIESATPACRQGG